MAPKGHLEVVGAPHTQPTQTHKRTHARKTHKQTQNKTGLQVPAIGVGAWSWGDRSGYWGYGKEYGKEASLGAYEELLKAGLTFIDTAEARVYWLARECLLRGGGVVLLSFLCHLLAAFPLPAQHLTTPQHNTQHAAARSTASASPSRSWASSWRPSPRTARP